ncbi:MAG: hypothetical protein WBP26_00740 [Candidatus Saccharimonadales bacterium]
MHSVFDDVELETLVELDDKKAVQLLHKLIYSELRRLGITTNLVSVPYNVDIADGGIDATVDTDDNVDGSELIFAGKTYYQVKSGRNVSFTDSGLKNIVCKDAVKGKKRELKPKIEAIVKENGTLVVFLTGKSDPGAEQAEKDLLKLLKTFHTDTTVKVKLIQADNLINMLGQYLAIRLWLKNDMQFPGKLFEEWSKDPLMDTVYKTDEKRSNIVSNIQSLAKSDDADSKVIRVSGFPGNGKTRSVLEALRNPELEPMVVYFEKPSTIRDSGRLHAIGSRSTNEVILVVDECDGLSHNQIAAALAGTGNRVKLITIYNEPVNEVSPAKYIDLDENEVLEENSIIEIMKSYKPITEDVAKKWAPFCDGSPRVAHMIAQNLRNNTGDLLRRPDYDYAMERFLANRDDIQSEEFKRRKAVLSWLGQFRKFGWSAEFSNERNFIIKKILSKASYSEDDINNVVNELKKRKVLQGDKTLYISPRLLHIRAWVWWWDANKDAFDLNDFKLAKHQGEEFTMPSDLYGWYTEMFEYAREVEGASIVVRDLLATDGPLKNEPELMEALSGNFFLSLTKADPEQALLLLEQWFSTKTDEDLRSIRQGRMNLVRALEMMAVWEMLFVRSANLLLRLAATEEDHTYSNNSEGSFADLFSNGWGKVAPTEAAPTMRYPVMEYAVKSEDPRYVKMGLNAISHALESNHFMRVMGAEVQGLREEPKLWTPNTYDEIFDAIRSAWLLLLEVLPSLEGENREEALKVINHQIRGLLSLKISHTKLYLAEYVGLVKDGIIPLKDAIDTVNTIRRYDAKGKDILPEVAEGINALSDYLDTGDINALLKRYIQHNSMEDWWGDDEDIAKSTSKVAGIVRAIIDDPSILDKNLWLFTKSADNSWRLGRGLAELDKKMSLLERMFKLQKESDEKNKDDASCLLLSGYLYDASQLQDERWKKILSSIETDNELVHWYAEICWRTNIDDRSADTILELVRQGKVESADFNLFRLGGVTKKIGPTAFNRWINFLLEQNELLATTAAIDLFSSRYVFQETAPIPKEISLRLLTSEALVKEKNRQVARDVDYDWSQIADRYIDQYPNETEELAKFVVKNFGEDDTIFGAYDEYAKSVINRIAKQDPQKVWELVSKQLEDGRLGFKLEMSWLGGGAAFGDEKPDGAISIFPKDLIFEWIDKDPSKRASTIARVVPKDFDIENTEDSWFRNILHKYGNYENVQSSLSANLMTDGWSGPASVHYAKKLERVRRFSELNKNSPNIQKWTAKMVSGLSQQVDRSRMEEERRDF